LEYDKKILEIADQIWRKVGFRAMTLDEIAIQLGISKKTIYLNFESKDALVDKIMELEINRIKEDCVHSLNISVNAIDEIFISMEMMTNEMAETNPIVVHDLKKFYPDAFRKFVSFKSAFYYNIIADNLKRGIKENLYKKDINIDVLTKLRIEQLLLPFDQSIFPPDQYNFIEVNQIIIKHFLDAIVTENGRKYISEIHKNINKPLPQNK
jgi:hypothetical protein